MTPLEIINTWIDYGHNHNLFHGTDGCVRRKRFWRTRDLLEGIAVNDEAIQGCLEYLTKHCRETEQRAILIGAIRAIRPKGEEHHG